MLVIPVRTTLASGAGAAAGASDPAGAGAASRRTHCGGDRFIGLAFASALAQWVAPTTKRAATAHPPALPLIFMDLR